MERTEFVAILEPLCVALGADFDQPTWTAYFRALSDVPAKLLEAAVTVAMREDRKFMPRPGELRTICEARRQELMALHPWERCLECGRTGQVKVGVIQLATGHRVPKYGRCSCYAAYQRRLEDLGISEKPLAYLPSAAPAEPDYVDAAVVLPADIVERASEIARAKVMK